MTAACRSFTQSLSPLKTQLCQFVSQYYVIKGKALGRKILLQDAIELSLFLSLFLYGLDIQN